MIVMNQWYYLCLADLCNCKAIWSRLIFSPLDVLTTIASGRISRTETVTVVTVHCVTNKTKNKWLNVIFGINMFINDGTLNEMVKSTIIISFNLTMFC